MVSMSEFLSGFSYHGQPVVAQGVIDPTRQRTGLPSMGAFGLGQGGQRRRASFSSMSDSGVQTQSLSFGGGGEQDQQGDGKYGFRKGKLKLDPSDFVFGGPEIFARLLQTGEMDGGFLSEAGQNRQFAAETSGIMGLFGRQQEQQQQAAAQANLNPIFAQRQQIEQGYGVLGQLLGRRAELGGELEARKFGAQQAFANMLAETTAGEKQFRVNTLASLAGAQIGAEGAIAGGKAAAKGAEKAGLYSAIGAIGGAAI